MCRSCMRKGAAKKNAPVTGVSAAREAGEERYCIRFYGTQRSNFRVAGTATGARIGPRSGLREAFPRDVREIPTRQRPGI